MQPYKSNTGLNPGQYSQKSYGTSTPPRKPDPETTALHGEPGSYNSGLQQHVSHQNTYQDYGRERTRVEQQIKRQEAARQPVSQSDNNSQPQRVVGGETKKLVSQPGHYGYSGPPSSYGGTTQQPQDPVPEQGFFSKYFNF